MELNSKQKKKVVIIFILLPRQKLPFQRWEGYNCRPYYSLCSENNISVKPHKSHWTNFPLLSSSEISVKKQHCIEGPDISKKTVQEHFGDFPFLFSRKILVCRNKIFMKEKWITKTPFYLHTKGARNTFTHRKKKCLFNYTAKEKFEKVKNDGWESLKRRNKIFIRISFEY